MAQVVLFIKPECRDRLKPIEDLVASVPLFKEEEKVAVPNYQGIAQIVVSFYEKHADVTYTESKFHRWARHHGFVKTDQTRCYGTNDLLQCLGQTEFFERLEEQKLDFSDIMKTVKEMHSKDYRILGKCVDQLVENYAGIRSRGPTLTKIKDTAAGFKALT
jgi:hypothetical protein